MQRAFFLSHRFSLWSTSDWLQQWQEKPPQDADRESILDGREKVVGNHLCEGKEKRFPPPSVSWLGHPLTSSTKCLFLPLSSRVENMNRQNMPRKDYRECRAKQEVTLLKHNHSILDHLLDFLFSQRCLLSILREGNKTECLCVISIWVLNNLIFPLQPLCNTSPGA